MLRTGVILAVPFFGNGLLTSLICQTSVSPVLFSCTMRRLEINRSQIKSPMLHANLCAVNSLLTSTYLSIYLFIITIIILNKQALIYLSDQ